jgi:ribonuclease P protein component/ribosomal protein L34
MASIENSACIDARHMARPIG